MVHQYINNGYHIVLDVNSGCVHVVDELAYDVIPIVEKLLAQQMEEKEQMAVGGGRGHRAGGDRGRDSFFERRRDAFHRRCL